MDDSWHGALVLAIRTGLPERLWITLLIPAAAIAGGLALRAWKQPDLRVLLGPLFAVTVFGIWTTVPDTEEARALLSAALPLAIATSRKIDARITGAGAFAVSALLAWVAGTGGAGREASIIGALWCLGLLALIPAIQSLKRTLPHLRPSVVFVSHGFLVFLAARVFGLWQSAPDALSGVVATSAVAVLVGFAISKPVPARTHSQ